MCMWLWLWVVRVTRRVLRQVIEKNLDCLEKTVYRNVDVNNVSSEVPERKERFYYLGKYIIMNRKLLEIWTLKVLLVIYQMKMKNMWLENGGKVIFVTGDTKLRWIICYYFCKKKNLQLINLIYLRRFPSKMWKI